jgi:hypothetical protein
VILSPASRLERHFPVQGSAPASALFANPAPDSSVPPLDLLKVSTFLRKRSYATFVQSRAPDAISPEPHAVVLTPVFSWDIPALRRAIAHIHGGWPVVTTIPTGVLPSF